MRPLEIVYWLRLAFGFIAALVSLGFAIAVYGTPLPPVRVKTADQHLFQQYISCNNRILAFILYSQTEVSRQGCEGFEATHNWDRRLLPNMDCLLRLVVHGVFRGSRLVSLFF